MRPAASLTEWLSCLFGARWRSWSAVYFAWVNVRTMGYLLHSMLSFIILVWEAKGLLGTGRALSPECDILFFLYMVQSPVITPVRSYCDIISLKKSCGSFFVEF